MFTFIKESIFLTIKKQEEILFLEHFNESANTQGLLKLHKTIYLVYTSSYII